MPTSYDEAMRTKEKSEAGDRREYWQRKDWELQVY